MHVNNFGLFLAFIFPGAYVDLCNEHLQIISPIRQLRFICFSFFPLFSTLLTLLTNNNTKNRIFCAGVWHNFVLVLLAVCMLQLHPLMMSALFVRGAHVLKIHHVCTYYYYYYRKTSIFSDTSQLKVTIVSSLN